MKTWTHPGGKLRELGAESLTDAELLAILLSTGTKGKTAEEVAKEILDKDTFTAKCVSFITTFSNGLYT